METIALYERWVNGQGLSPLSMLRNRVGVTCADICERREAGSVAGAIAISLPEADGCEIPLPALRAAALLPVTHVVLHGSQATHDSCDFSDVDVVVVLDDEKRYANEAHAAAMLELRRLLHAMYAYDPLMHHGFMFVGTSTVHAYDQSFLPLETFEHARRLHGPATLEFSVVEPNRQTAKRRVRSAAESLRRHFAESIFERDDFRLKEGLSGLLLMPALTLAAQGQYVYKRESFTIARDLFAGREWDAIRVAEEFRHRWVRPPRAVFSRLVSTNVHPITHLKWSAHRSPAMNVRRLLSAGHESWLSSIGSFLNRVEELSA